MPYFYLIILFYNQVSYDAGHLIANSLGGSGTSEDNLVPMSRTLNRGAYNQWERMIVRFLRGQLTEEYRNYQINQVGASVLIDIRLRYEDDTFIPARVIYDAAFYDSDGNQIMVPWETAVIFKNYFR